jgi:spermidine/putrescine transport system permease protein
MLLGGSGGSMLGQFVLQEFSTRFNWPAGAALSFGLLAACLVVLAVFAAIIFRRRAA